MMRQGHLEMGAGVFRGEEVDALKDEAWANAMLVIREE